MQLFPTQVDDDDRRASGRVALRIPVEIELNAATHSGSTAVVNDHGALLVSSIPCTPGDLVKLRNLITGERALFRIAGNRNRDARWGGFSLGVAIVQGSGPDFWGPGYQHIAHRRRA